MTEQPKRRRRTYKGCDAKPERSAETDALQRASLWYLQAKKRQGGHLLVRRIEQHGYGSRRNAELIAAHREAAENAT